MTTYRPEPDDGTRYTEPPLPDHDDWGQPLWTVTHPDGRVERIPLARVPSHIVPVAAEGRRRRTAARGGQP